MKMKKETMAEVVTEASAKMTDPNYSAVLVGDFVENQAPAVQFISAHEPELGGAEAIISVICHCALIGQAFARAAGRTSRELSFDDLDAVASGDALKALETRQPAPFEFIMSNVEHPVAQKLIALVALAMDSAS